MFKLRSITTFSAKRIVLGILLVLFCGCPVEVECVTAENEIPGEVFEWPPEPAPKRQPHDSRTSDEDNASRLLRGVLDLIQNNYVREISVRHELENALSKLTFVLLPHCVEGMIPIRKCSDGPEKCFMNAIHGVAQRCNQDVESVLLAGLRALLRDLDPYTELMNEAMVKELKATTSGKFGGVGMVVAPRHGDYRVITCLDGSPAQKAGIEAGDVVEALDGDPIRGLLLYDVLTKVRGPVGSSITVTIRHADSGGTRTVRLRRKLIQIPPIRDPATIQGIGYLRIVNFQTNTVKYVHRALRRMSRDEKGRLRGLILDLRDNPGGLFDEAIKVANLLLDSGVITVLRGRRPQMNRVFEAKVGTSMPQVPVAVIINRGTASAAEILAGAMKGRPGVLVMGERSFGKASVQGIFYLQRGMALRLTTAHYYTAEGSDIDGRGIEPDLFVEDPDWRTGKGRAYPGSAQEPAKDPMVQQALKKLSGAIAGSRAEFSPR